MILRDRLLIILKDKPLTTKQIQKQIPDKNNRIIAATISQNQQVFLRLEKGLVGLVDRDEHLVTGKPIKAGKLCLYKKICNLLINQERTNQELYKLLPEEKPVSIRATINMNPHLFIRIAYGVVGRKDRDEHLIERYTIAKQSTKIQKRRMPTIAEKLTYILLEGEKQFKKYITEYHNIQEKALLRSLV